MKTRTQKLVILSIIAFSIESAANNAADSDSYSGSSFGEVWTQVKSDPYGNPNNKVSLRSLSRWGKSLIENAANRTLSDRADVLPQFDKLAHPNGICLMGSWNITEANSYSGYFRKNSQAAIIVRASTALSNTKQGATRAFGMAGKIFPTQDSETIVPTGNFFVVDDLGGTDANHYTGVGLTNEPPVSKTFEVILNIAYALKLQKVFGKADSNPAVRQVYEISEMGESNLDDVRTPKWMKIQAQQGQTVNALDFRDELNIKNYNGQLYFDIYVSSPTATKDNKDWQKIGHILFVDSVVSNSCDHRLHFHHPRWKSDLK